MCYVKHLNTGKNPHLVWAISHFLLGIVEVGLSEDLTKPLSSAGGEGSQLSNKGVYQYVRETVFINRTKTEEMETSTFN